LLRIGFLLVAWLAVLWLVPPTDLSKCSPPMLMALHLGPPFAWALAWVSGRVVLRRVHARREARVEQEIRSELEASAEAEETARQTELARRRVFLECRGIWVATPEAPAWMGGETSRECKAIRQDVEKICGAGREGALTASLQCVFEAVLSQNPALAFLPVAVCPEGGFPDGALKMWVNEAWRLAVESSGENLPGVDCRLLAGEGDICERAIALFEHDPALPALLLLGMDSPLADDLNKDDALGSAGHAVAVVLLSRSNLAVRAKVLAAAEFDAGDPYKPYWVRPHGDADAAHWGSVPAHLRMGFLSMPPFARLHLPQTGRAEAGAKRQTAALSRHIATLASEALINGMVRDPRPADAPRAEEPEPMELDWIAHNAGLGAIASLRIAALTDALASLGCESSAQDMETRPKDEYGNVGVASHALLLAEALYRAPRSKKPVFIAAFGEDYWVSVGLARAVGA
jgi:hypothetical protein